MWPTSDRYSEVLASGNRRWATRLEVLYEGEAETTLDVVVEGDVSLDDVAVRRSLNLTLVDPHGDLTPTTAKDLLAPKGTEIRVLRGLLVDGEYEWVPLGVFGIAAPKVSAHGNAGTVIELSGFDRVDAVRSRRFAAPWVIARDTLTHEAIAEIVATRLPGTTMRITTTGNTTPALVFDRLSDPWDAVRNIADADALAAYFDPLGTFIVTPELVQETGVVYEPGPQSLLLDSEREIDAERTYSGVQVSSEHPDTDPVFYEIWDLDTKSPTYADGPFGRRPFGFSSPVIRTLAQAEIAARTLLPRVTRMRQTATLHTVGHPGHDVGDIVTVIDPKTRIAGKWMITGGSIPVRAGVMTLKLAEIPDAVVLATVTDLQKMSDSDSFNKPDSTTSMGTTVEGRAWGTDPSTVAWGIISGQAYMPSPSDNRFAFIDAGVVNARIEARLTIVPSSAWSLTANFVSGANYYRIFVREDGSALLDKRVNDTTITVRPFLPAGTFKTGDMVGIQRINGNQFIYYRNGVEIERSAADETDMPKSTRFGFRHGGGVKGLRWDDFSIRES